MNFLYMSEEMMRDARTDKLMLFMKMRYKDQLRVEDPRQTGKVRELLNDAQRKIGEQKHIDIKKEKEIIQDLFKQL